MDDEKWKVIKGFPDYRISTYGRIISYKSGQWKELRPYKDKITGYYKICLMSNGKTYTKAIHRLVAETFLKNNGYCLVRHLDDNRDNNFVGNLQWGDYRDNYFDSKKNGTAARVFRPVKSLNLKTGEIKYYESVSEASKETGCDLSCISAICNGASYRSKEYTFADANNDFQDVERAFYAINNITGEQILYLNQSQASRELGLCQSNISACLLKKRKRVCEWSFKYANRVKNA